MLRVQSRRILSLSVHPWRILQWSHLGCRIRWSLMRLSSHWVPCQRRLRKRSLERNLSHPLLLPKRRRHRILDQHQLNHQRSKRNYQRTQAWERQINLSHLWITIHLTGSKNLVEVECPHKREDIERTNQLSIQVLTPEKVRDSTTQKHLSKTHKSQKEREISLSTRDLSVKWKTSPLYPKNSSHLNKGWNLERRNSKVDLKVDRRRGVQWDNLLGIDHCSTQRMTILGICPVLRRSVMTIVNQMWRDSRSEVLMW